MKLSRKAQISLGIGIFVILMGSLIVAYLQQGEEQDQLSQELSSAQLLFDKQEADFASENIPLRVRVLESQLNIAESNLEAVKAQLRWSIDSTKITETCFAVAEDTDVEIVVVGSQDSDNVDMEGVDLSVLLFTATAEGNISKLIDFISELSAHLPTGVLESVAIDVEKPSATVEMSIYSYEGD
ncbi:MAG TPA: hypothetical protein G4O12_09190 [Dehalococcoidia bacterium]|nr:hypothetical protein [Dehalococcoidia bacterium]